MCYGHILIFYMKDKRMGIIRKSIREYIKVYRYVNCFKIKSAFMQ